MKSEHLSNTAESWAVNRSMFKNEGSCQICSFVCTFKKIAPSTMTLPHLFPFSSQEGQLKASDVYFPPEVTRTLLHGPNAHCSHTAVLRSNWEQTFWSWLTSFFAVMYNHRKQVLIKFIFNTASSPVSCFQVRTSWISSPYVTQLDLQAPPPLAKTDWRCQFKAWFPTSRFQKWNFFISWRMKSSLWVEKSGLVHLILENWVAGLIFLALSVHVEMLQWGLVLPGTAQPVPRLRWKGPFPDPRRGLELSSAVQHCCASPTCPLQWQLSCILALQRSGHSPRPGCCPCQGPAPCSARCCHLRLWELIDQ